MNFDSRIRVAIGAAAVALGAMGLPAASHAGTVTIDATPHCTGFNSISMDPAGNLQINGCTTSSTPPPSTTLPSCTIALSASTITAGGSATISANCTNGPITAYNWQVSNFGPAVSGQSATVNFPSAGTYTYTVSGTNASGTGANSFGASVTVNPVSTGGGGNTSGCAIQPASFYDTLNTNQKQISIDRNGYVALYLPIADHAGQMVNLSTVQVNQQPLNLKAQISVSPCPGDFTANPPECRAWGTVYMGAISLTVFSATTPVTGGSCQFQVGKQYFINVRNIAFDLVTPSCPYSSCSEFITNNTNF